MEGAENCMDRTAADCREEGGDDEEKMETFFAEMQRFRNKLRQLQEGNAGNNKRKRASGGGGGWAPAFRIEDFTAEIEFKRHVPVSPENVRDDVGNRKRDDDAVEPKLQSPPNLKLTL